MNPARLSFAILMLAYLLTGCRHKIVPAPAPVVTPPPLPPSSMTHTQSLPPVPQPGPPKAGPPGSDKQTAEEQPAPAPKPTHRTRKHAPAADATTAATATTTANQAATPTPTAAQVNAPSSSPKAPEPSLGQLSAGSGADSHERAAMTDEIHTQELRLNAIKHPLNSESEAITLQVKAFLTKARQAATENDLDGARTLTMKAKVLLDELSSS